MKHQNLLRLHEVHETKNSMYLVLDIYNGGELSKLLETKTGINEQDCINIVTGLLRGINFMAHKNFVHRDLKPNNIMLRKNTNIQPEDVVIVDFGLAVSIHEKNMIYRRCGTPGYIAPEIIGAKNVDVSFSVNTKSDVFGIGAILFQMMVGRNPFEKPEYNVDQIIKKNLECKIDYPTALSKYSPELVKLLKQMLIADPQQRPSARSLLQAQIFGSKNEEYNCVECDIDECISRPGDVPANLINRVPSLHKRVGLGGCKDNDSLDIKSKDAVDNISLNSELDGANSRKCQLPSLYKQSLMKGFKNPNRNLSTSSPKHLSTASGTKDSSNGFNSDNESTASLTGGKSPFGNSCLNSPQANQQATRRISNFINPGLSPFARVDVSSRPKDV